VKEERKEETIPSKCESMTKNMKFE